MSATLIPGSFQSKWYRRPRRQDFSKFRLSEAVDLTIEPDSAIYGASGNRRNHFSQLKRFLRRRLQQTRMTILVSLEWKRTLCNRPTHKGFTTKPLTPWHQYAYSPYCFIYISYGACKENLFENQTLLQSVIICFILLTLMFDSGVIL